MQLLNNSQLEELKSLSTPAVANAIESFNVRMRNEGYMKQSISSRVAHSTSMVGYAITIKMRTDRPPVRWMYYPERTDWWSTIVSAPHPKIIVIEDTDTSPGVGSVCGGLHCSIFEALGCLGIITNGAVRDLLELQKQKLHVYSKSVSPTHAYAHVVEVGTPVVIGGLNIASGDLLHGDQNGIIKIPHAIAADVYKQAQIQLKNEKKIIDFCHSAEFYPEKLAKLIANLFPEEQKE